MKSFKQYVSERLRTGRQDHNILGSFEEDGHVGYYGPVCEMARIGHIPKNKSKEYYEVVVWTDDPGYIPHVHIRDKHSRGKELDCCVKLESPEYFPHGRHKDTLNSDIKKAFVKFINSWDNKEQRTIYEIAVYEWNRNNSVAEIDIKYDKYGNPIIPDYNMLP